MTQGNPVRVLLVDDHPVVRDGLKAFLLTRPDLLLAGEASGGRQAVEETLRTRPDVVLMDLNLPDLDGLAAARQIRDALPATQVILLTGRLDGPISAAEAAQAGLAGCLLKTVSMVDLAQAIRAAARGEPAAGAAPPVPHAEEPPVSLTPRERDVLRELAAGRSNKEIAAALAITPATVKGHLAAIRGKLGLSDRTQAAVYAAKHGLAG